MDILPTEGKILAGLAASYTGWRWADGKYHIAHDVAALRRLVPMMVQALRWFKTPGWGVSDMWRETLSNIDVNKVALIRAETGQTYTFRQLDELSNQVANWLVSVKRFTPGSCVALYMENDPLYIAVWLGMAKAGIEVAMLNSNVKGKPLVHSVQVSKACGIIYGTGHCASNVAAQQDALRAQGVESFAVCKLDEPQEAVLQSLSEIPSSIDFLAHVSAAPATAVDAKARRGHLKHAGHTFGYIYTSGTTGMPKACKISHLKLTSYSTCMPAYHVDGNDIIYGSGMPLYHTAANLGVMAMVRQGATYIVRKKFSASNHWKECAKYKATVMQYIGELCRYLLAAQPNPAEKQHRLRVAVGNGLRPEIWNDFQRRNNIPEIGEFYGATEGNAFTFNHCKNYTSQGAVGKSGAILQTLKPMHIVKFDIENEEPVRDPKTGYCVVVTDGTPGELISPITNIPTSEGTTPDFEGYTSKEATEKKVLRNVFKQGDSYFRTGDLLRRKDGLTYFVDRIGDTFRWKGENVSTMEVSEVLSTYPGILEASVYGVEVPRADGRACMVALRMHDGQELCPEKFAAYVKANLPPYSMPLFIRFLSGMDTTGTFKHMKVEYKKAGFDPAKLGGEKLWYFDGATKSYKEMTPEAFDRFQVGQAKL